jgi:glycosyltransferase involved in cell wall biosynthesis
MATVNIVTPVFNGELYFRSCIESVINQSYQDWEYIIVDNCSQDRTAEIAGQYARHDNRIRIVRNTQLVDVIANHNIAFSKLDKKAKYCKVVQADDWIYPECIAKLVGLAEENPNITLVSAYRLDGDHIGLKGLPATRSVYSGVEIGRRLLFQELPDIFGSPTSHLFRAEPVRSRQPFYNPLNIHADTEACFAVLEDGDLGFIPEVLTFTRRPGNTETSRSDYLRSSFPGFLWILKNYQNLIFLILVYIFCLSH